MEQVARAGYFSDRRRSADAHRTPDRAADQAQSQALDRTQPLLPMRPGQVERRTHDYTRHGTSSLVAALHVKTGKVIGEFHRDVQLAVRRVDSHLANPIEIALDRMRSMIDRLCRSAYTATAVPTSLILAGSNISTLRRRSPRAWAPVPVT
jgi:hypothetical protein